jgi:hypothetical protein
MTEKEIISLLLRAMDRGLRCTVEDFIGPELFRAAAIVAGGHWAEIIAERDKESADK